MTNADILSRLRSAVATAETAHYGYNDIELDNLYDAIDAVREVITELEKTDVHQQTDT